MPTDPTTTATTAAPALSHAQASPDPAKAGGGSPGMAKGRFVQADATRLPFADGTFDLCFGSPPYLDARTYGIAAQRGCVAWVDWMLDVVAECCRVTRGLVLINCAGVTRKWRYQPGPEMLLADWWRRGGECWRPAYWHRVGIPGSGGRQWLRADVEYVLAFKAKPGPIPWADNTACGHPPKWGPGGEMSHRLGDGRRVNQWGGSYDPDSETNAKDVNGNPTRKFRPSHAVTAVRRIDRTHTKRLADGTMEVQGYAVPVKANPGNLVKVIVGGGVMGHPLAHENEAPFPEALAEFFIKSFCPPGGVVLDPFSGSGTTVATAVRLGRNGVGTDLRASQCELGRRRIREPHARKAKRSPPAPRATLDLFSMIGGAP